jgi:hypothetical protein
MPLACCNLLVGWQRALGNHHRVNEQVDFPTLSVHSDRNSKMMPLAVVHTDARRKALVHSPEENQIVGVGYFKFPETIRRNQGENGLKGTSAKKESVQLAATLSRSRGCGVQHTYSWTSATEQC